jgi:hypothetical protein
LSCADPTQKISGFYPIGKIFANYTSVDEIIFNCHEIYKNPGIKEEPSAYAPGSFHKISKNQKSMLVWTGYYAVNTLRVWQVNGEEQKNCICVQ